MLEGGRAHPLETKGEVGCLDLHMRKQSRALRLRSRCVAEEVACGAGARDLVPQVTFLWSPANPAVGVAVVVNVGFASERGRGSRAASARALCQCAWQRGHTVTHVCQRRQWTGRAQDVLVSACRAVEEWQHACQAASGARPLAAWAVFAGCTGNPTRGATAVILRYSRQRLSISTTSTTILAGTARSASQSARVTGARALPAHSRSVRAIPCMGMGDHTNHQANAGRTAAESSPAYGQLTNRVGMRGALAMNMQRSQMRRHTQPRGGFGAALLGVKVNSALASLAQCRPSARLATWMARTNRAACWPNASGAGSARCCHCRQHGPPPPRWTTP